MIAHATRSAILGNLFDIAGMRKKEDSAQELKHYHTEGDNNDVEKNFGGINETLNSLL